MFGAFVDALMNVPKMMHAEEMQNDSQQFNRAESIESRDWQERMSNTQYQRAAGDASAAGLNRILAMRQGGAGTPGGATASSGTTTGQTQSSFIQGEINSAQIANLREENERIRADTGLKKQDAALRSYEMDRTKAAERLTIQQEATERNNTDASAHAARKAKEDADIAEEIAKGKRTEGAIDDTMYGTVLRYVDRAMDALRGGSTAYERMQPPSRAPLQRPGLRRR